MVDVVQMVKLGKLAQQETMPSTAPTAQSNFIG